eukprot:154616-Pelagomonas_calceolata.AAC.5
MALHMCASCKGASTPMQTMELHMCILCIRGIHVHADDAAPPGILLISCTIPTCVSALLQISIKEGLIAPLAASVSLFTCYLLITFLPDLDISKLINAYFW